MLSTTGRNWGPNVNWDDLAKFFAAFAISWTVILYGGIGWLIYYSKLPSIRMRNVPLIIASTSFLHVYLLKIVLAYTTNGNFLCSAEFWIMSIYLPFGIALFQANMVQLLSISTQQRKLLDGNQSSISQPTHPRGLRGLWSRWKTLSPLKQAYVLIGVGMGVQVSCMGTCVVESKLIYIRLSLLLLFMQQTLNFKEIGARLRGLQVKSSVERVQNGSWQYSIRDMMTNRIGFHLLSGSYFGLQSMVLILCGNSEVYETHISGGSKSLSV